MLQNIYRVNKSETLHIQTEGYFAENFTERTKVRHYTWRVIRAENLQRLTKNEKHPSVRDTLHIFYRERQEAKYNI